MNHQVQVYQAEVTKNDQCVCWPILHILLLILGDIIPDV
jgi:hypothetical protein